jgi:hypothetical protein
MLYNTLNLTERQKKGGPMEAVVVLEGSDLTLEKITEQCSVRRYGKIIKKEITLYTYFFL